MSSLGRICPVVLEKILKFVNAFLLFCNYLPFVKGLDLHIIKNWVQYFVPSLVENVPVVLEKFAKVSIMYFYYFAIISTLRRAGPSFEKKNESSSPKDALYQVWLKMAQWFWSGRFLKVLNVFLLFPNYLPFEKDVALHLNKLKSSSPSDTLCQVWLKLAQWFWRRWKCEKFTDRWTDG